MKKRMALLCAALALTGSAAAQGSIGVIGGADGPTTIIVATGEGFWMLPAGAVLIAAAIIWLIVRRRRKGRGK